MHKHDVVVRCGKGQVGQVDWTFRMRDGAGIQNASAKVCTYGGSCKSASPRSSSRSSPSAAGTCSLVKVPFVGRSPDITKVVATVT